MFDFARELPAVLGGEKAIQTPIPSWPVVKQHVIDAVVKCLQEGRVTELGTDGTRVQDFEEAFRAYHGSRYVLSMNSGTAALDAAMYAAGVGPGDEVITSPVCPAYVLTPILHMNAIPVFADVDHRTGNLDPNDITRHITPATKAIMVIHLSGHPADMDAINAIAKKHGLRIIEDCAHAQGSTYKGRRTGTMGDFGAFSLQSIKNLGCGEGGVLLTNDKELFDRSVFVNWKGCGYTMEDGSPTYFGNGLGYSNRIALLTAVIGGEQMKDFEEVMALRKKNAEIISEGVKQFPGYLGTYTLPDCTQTYYEQQIHFDPEVLGLELPELLWALDAEGISVNPIYVPAFLAGIYQKKEYYGKGCPWSCPHAQGRTYTYDPKDYPNTEKMRRTTVRMLFGGITAKEDIQALECVKAFGKIAVHADKVRAAYRAR